MTDYLKLRSLFSTLLVLLLTMPTRAQVLIEEGGKPVPGQVIHRDQTSYNSGDYSSTEQFRSDRRVGVGLGLAGKLGLAGASLELNFTPENSFMIGFGGGYPFKSFAVDWKRNFGGNYFSPYLSAGYARWYNSAKIDGGIEYSMPSNLVSEYLTPSEVQTGQFALNFLTPTLGVQYHQLSGEYQGSALYLEVVVLTELSSFRAIPTGAFGLYYYF